MDGRDVGKRRQQLKSLRRKGCSHAENYRKRNTALEGLGNPQKGFVTLKQRFGRTAEGLGVATQLRT